MIRTVPAICPLCPAGVPRTAVASGVDNIVANSLLGRLGATETESSALRIGAVNTDSPNVSPPSSET